MRIRIFHTEGFRIAAIFVAIFAISAAALAIVTLAVVDQELRSQIVQFANADIGSVKDGYRTQGVREASEVVGQRMASPGASDFFLLQRNGSEKLAGNLPPMQALTGVIEFPHPAAAGRAILGVGAFVAPGLYVFAGSDLRATQMARQRILRTLIWIFAGALALALLGGTIVSRTFLRRTDEIVTTCRAIMAGNLASRISVRGTEDELDRLSETINAMLDRIAALMDNLKQITSDIAHDLRTPVTHLRHRLERARDQSSKVEDYDQALEAAIAASDDILALFSALLRIAQIEGGARRANFAPLDLSGLLTRLGDVFGPVAEDARHHLSLAPGDPVTILGDRELLTQAFSNLIENAILHTPAGTIVTVSLAHRNGEAVVTISDDGPGVPPDEHPKLFQRFYRLEASRTRPGYGLGLPLVAAIAELHGASIAIESQPGRGFAISLRFPGNMDGA
ncbi:MAG: HAMP domain-containing histidine kinase [Alphaproteobacteria bacterium]|nr:HAMP domain-containing histidine kinase [Alphaproteobacteria bacterium]